MALFGKKKTNPQLDAIKQHLHGSEKAGNPMALGHAATLINDDEQVVSAAGGKLDGANAVLVATDRRIVIATAKGLSLGETDIPYASVDHIEVGTSLGGSWITLQHGSHEVKVAKSVSKNFPAIRDFVRSQQSSGTPTQASGVGVDQLEKLAELHAQGVLTDDEFAAAKAKALGL